MARRARSKDTCRFCGDIAEINPDTFKATGVCKACAAPKVKGARRQRKAERRADREVVETVEAIKCPTCQGPLTVSHCSPTEAARRGYQCDPCADAQERGEDMAWRREIAMEAGMGLGIDAFNEHMGNA